MAWGIRDAQKPVLHSDAKGLFRFYMRCAPNVSRLHEQVSKSVGNAARYVVRVPLLVRVGLGIVHLRCMRDARALCIALRSLAQALCMWFAHMFGRSMRGSHVETETCTLEARTCCLCHCA